MQNASVAIVAPRYGRAARLARPRRQGAAMTGPRRPFLHRPERRHRLVLAAIEAIGAPRFCPCVGSRTVIGLAAAPLRGRLAGSPNVRLPNPIAAFRAQGRLGQLSARSGLLHRSKNDPLYPTGRGSAGSRTRRPIRANFIRELFHAVASLHPPSPHSSL